MSTTTATETMTDAYDGLKFVTVDPNASSPPRTKELARSAARSHASLVVHRKRQAANRKRIASNRLILNTEVPDNQCEPTQIHDRDNEYSEDYGSLANWPSLAPLHLQSALCENFSQSDDGTRANKSASKVLSSLRPTLELCMKSSMSTSSGKTAGCDG